MPRGSWKTISIPEEMYSYIDDLIKHPYIKRKYGFSGVPEFVRNAVTEYIRKLEKEIEEDKEKRILNI